RARSHRVLAGDRPDVPQRRQSGRTRAPHGRPVVSPASTARRDDWNEHWVSYEDATRENPAQSYRRRLVFSRLEGPPSPTRLLDIGSGPGALAAGAAARWPEAELAGVELSASGIRMARTKVPRAQFEQRDLLEVADPSRDLAGWATHAVCSEVLEHVD